MALLEGISSNMVVSVAERCPKSVAIAANKVS